MTQASGPAWGDSIHESYVQMAGTGGAGHLQDKIISAGYRAEFLAERIRAQVIPVFSLHRGKTEPHRTCQLQSGRWSPGFSSLP